MAKVKDKDRILKAAREWQLVTYKKTPIRLSAGFSTETFQARKDWSELFKLMKTKDLRPRVLQPARISFNSEEEIKNLRQEKAQEFVTTKQVLQEILESLLDEAEKKSQRNIVKRIKRQETHTYE